MPRRRPAFAAFAQPEPRPMADLNTTPLIDVMLVLLIMFILSVPIATHSVKLDLPTGAPLPADPIVHRLDMDAAGRLFWDGAPVAEAALPQRLETLERAGPHASLHFAAHAEARYEDFDRVLALVKGAGIERLGLVGNHAHAAALPVR